MTGRRHGVYKCTIDDRCTVQIGELDGKVALITGASNGIGLATAQYLIAEGADHVFITGRRQQTLDEAIQPSNSTNVTALQGDACNMADLDKWVHFVQREKGRLDILFANAGIGECPVKVITVRQKQPSDPSLDLGHPN